MKIKVLLLTATLAFSRLAAVADEGMFLPMLINKNYDEMKKLGFKLTAEDIYNVNNASIKDAIVSLDFCTGEIISNEGLMLTNHHCAYGSIQSHSSVDHDYLTNGFWAQTKADELPSPEVNASILVRMEDVTAQVLKEINGLPEAEKAAKTKEIFKKITDEAIKDTWYTANVRDVFGGNQYLLFVYERFTDVRLVGAPPSSIGKFGGDTDNWMWPRHTGDFSLFRIYMSPDGKPAPYSKDNVPYKPKKFLPISLKGIKANDFAMVMGFPGRTNRYAFSYELQNAVDRANPAIVTLLGKRLEIMKADMNKSDEVRIKLADTYASLSNTWKYYIGQNEGLHRLDVIAGKKKDEVAFARFANSSTAFKEKYGNVLPNIEKAFNEYKPYAVSNLYVNLGGLASGISQYAMQASGLANALKNPDDKETLNREIEKIKEELDEHFKDYVAATDERILAGLLAVYNKDIPADQQPPVLAEILKKYKAATPEQSFTKFARDVFKRSIFASREKMEAFLAKPNLKVIQKDPAYSFATKINEFRGTYTSKVTAYSTALAKEKKNYIAGLMEMHPGKIFYPDANSTLRISYGKVLDYAPRDAVKFDYVTTAKGILEKEDPTNDEFIVPEKLMDLIRKGDFGQYGENGELVVAFLTDNDITGGNSGSPVINANGELIGVAFDGNWEAMTGDLVFDQNYKRTISVDIRYVLFVIDKFAGAGHLIKEMTIRK